MTRTSLTLLTGLTGLSLALAAGSAFGANDPQEVERKRTAILATISELGDRPTDHLSPALAAERAKTLDRLEAYARHGVFIQNSEFPTRFMPSFVDAHGTRCAIAHLMDESGASELVTSLAARNNHAFLSELADDPQFGEVATWLRDHGLTIDEAAYIQGPGFGGEPPPEPSSGPTQLPGPNTGGPNGPTTGPGTTPQAGPVTGRRRGGPITGRRRPSAPTSTWESWWDLNRDAFTNVRARFHDGAVVTGAQTEGLRARRPSDEEVSSRVIPMLQELTEEDDDIAATALMARARIAHGDDAAQIIPAVEEYLRHTDAQYREFAVLALGVLGDPAGEPRLIGVLTDSGDGRKLLRERNRLPENIRALAAIGLALCGGADAADALLDVLEDEKASRVDLRSSAAIALGLLGRDESLCARILPRLHKVLAAEEGPTQVLAHVPLALGRIADPASIPALLGMVAKFKGKVEVRRSAALALGRFTDSVDPELLEGLFASSRRDPDPLVRQFAILSIGELSAGAVPQEMIARLSQYHVDGVTGFFKQAADRPWHALAAGLFARHRPSARGDVLNALRGGIKGRATSEMRAACAISLGIGNDRMAAVLLRQQLKESGNPRVKGYAAEALGLLGDQASQARMIELVKEDGDAWVRYRAAIGLGLLGSVESVSSLVEILKDGKNDSVRAALTRAIGEIGDQSAVDGLIAIADDRRQVDMTRARAAAALGLTAQTADASWIALVKRGYNDSVATPSLRAVLNLF